MELFGGVVLLNPKGLYLIGLFFVLAFLIYRTSQFGIKFKFTKDLNNSFWKSYIFWCLRYFSVFMVVFCFTLLIANPNKITLEKQPPKEGIDIEILLDISFSTLARDIEPNRIEAAKKVISDFSDEIISDRLWLMVFARKPFNVVPLTYDYDAFKELAEEVSVESINQGAGWLAWTNIWDSLISAYNSFITPEREKVIILISDWSHNVPQATNPISWANFLAEKWVKIHTIWIWDTDPVLVSEIWIVVDPVDELWLMAIAEIWGGKYFRATDSEGLKKIFDELLELEKTESEPEIRKKYTPQYNILLAFMLFFMTLFAFLEIVYNHRN